MFLQTISPGFCLLSWGVFVREPCKFLRSYFVDKVPVTRNMIWKLDRNSCALCRALFFFIWDDDDDDLSYERRMCWREINERQIKTQMDWQSNRAVLAWTYIQRQTETRQRQSWTTNAVVWQSKICGGKCGRNRPLLTGIITKNISWSLQLDATFFLNKQWQYSKRKKKKGRLEGRNEGRMEGRIEGRTEERKLRKGRKEDKERRRETQRYFRS